MLLLLLLLHETAGPGTTGAGGRLTFFSPNADVAAVLFTDRPLMIATHTVQQVASIVGLQRRQSMCNSLTVTGNDRNNGVKIQHFTLL